MNDDGLDDDDGDDDDDDGLYVLVQEIDLLLRFIFLIDLHSLLWGHRQNFQKPGLTFFQLFRLLTQQAQITNLEKV